MYKPSCVSPTKLVFVCDSSTLWAAFCFAYLPPSCARDLDSLSKLGRTLFFRLSSPAELFLHVPRCFGRAVRVSWNGKVTRKRRAQHSTVSMSCSTSNQVDLPPPPSRRGALRITVGTNVDGGDGGGGNREKRRKGGGDERFEGIKKSCNRGSFSNNGTKLLSNR